MERAISGQLVRGISINRQMSRDTEDLLDWLTDPSFQEVITNSSWSSSEGDDDVKDKSGKGRMMRPYLQKSLSASTNHLNMIGEVPFGLSMRMSSFFDPTTSMNATSNAPSTDDIWAQLEKSSKKDDEANDKKRKI
jgi:hypothetical protein